MEENTKQRADGFRFWTLLWGLGIMAQITWNVENQWFNTYVYARISKDPSIITGMLICSAAATTFSTFFFGTWSDRTGRRRIFMSAGYILWGIFTILFGFTEFIPKQYYTLSGIMVVLADSVMSFFGSMANDSAYNAWSNDRMNDSNRGQIGACLATQPVLGTLLGTVVGGILVGEADNYQRLFLVIGALVMGFGIFSIFAMGPGDDVASSVRGNFWEQFLSVFDFKALVSRRELLYVHLSVAVFFIGFNTYFAYIGNYLIYYLGFTADQMGLVEAIPLVLAMASAIPVAGLINHNRHIPLAAVSVGLNILGLLVMLPIRPSMIDTTKIFHPQLFIGILLIGIGYISFLQTVKVWAKQLFPEESRGQFEGVWVVFFVLIPMIGGSLAGQTVVKAGGEMFLDEVSNRMQYIPNGNIFLAGAVLIALTWIPIFLAKRYFDRRVEKEA